MNLQKVNAALLKGLHVATAGMLVQNKRVITIAQNIANAGSRADAQGNQPYRRKTITFKDQLDKETGINLVKVKAIKADKSPFNKVYDPLDPAADDDGYVAETNVKPMVELSDMREAGRSHEANVKVFEKILQMLQNTISILKPQ